MSTLRLPAQRPACRADAARLSELMRTSILSLFPRFYDERQTASAAVHIGDLDLTLIDDGTYLVHEADGEVVRGDFTGDGPVDAIFRAINAATRREARLREFRIDAVTGGQDALGEASVILELSGSTAAGQGVSTDIIEAAALAYVRALSNCERRVVHAAAAAEEPEDAKPLELSGTP